MKLQAQVQPYILNFKFDAGTSRGVLKQKRTWFLKIWEGEKDVLFGIGEAGPLPGLSIDAIPEFEKKMMDVAQALQNFTLPDLLALNLKEAFSLHAFPSILFALETALFDLFNGGKRIIFHNSFAGGEQAIPINGLIWMGAKDFMQEQVKKKLQEGYSCIKVKIGALDFETELELLSSVRNSLGAGKIVLRVDANGAFAFPEAVEKMKRLAEYKVHSIEQPLKVGQYEEMAALCTLNILPIALDEDLIGIFGREDKKRLLEKMKAPYIILKPTLLGGFAETKEWIAIAEEMQIGWWITSALESNIGLNAIAQFTANLPIHGFHQGLGTGLLYTNNLESPLIIKQGKLFYDKEKKWNLKSVF